MPYSTNLRTDQVKQEFREITTDEMRELLNDKVKPTAQILCPRNEKLHKDQQVHTADSIGTRVRTLKKGIGGSIFTQSGRGGYIEAGTSHSAAQPFLMPAFLRYARDLIGSIALKIKTRSGRDNISQDARDRVRSALG